MRRLTAALAVVLALAGTANAQAPSQNLSSFLAGSPVTRGLTAISTETPILIKYIGSNANGGTVAVAAGGNITLSQGPVGSSTADASVVCGGGGNGVIVVANASCNTLGKVVDIINGSANWVAVILDGLRSDSSNDTLITLAESAGCNQPEGLGLLADGTVSFSSTLAVTQYRDIRSYVAAPSGLSKGSLIKNPFLATQTMLFEHVLTSTYGSGSSNVQILCVNLVNSRTTGGATETVTTYQKPGGATTVAQTYPYSNGLSCPTDQKLISRISNTAAMTAATHYVAGRVWRPVSATAP